MRLGGSRVSADSSTNTVPSHYKPRFVASLHRCQGDSTNTTLDVEISDFHSLLKGMSAQEYSRKVGPLQLSSILKRFHTAQFRISSPLLQHVQSQPRANIGFLHNAWLPMHVNEPRHIRHPQHWTNSMLDKFEHWHNSLPFSSLSMLLS